MTYTTFNFRTLFFLSVFVLFFSNLAKAQPATGEFININVGFGLSAPYENVDIIGRGFYLQGEYVLGMASWFGVRPYAGILITSEDKEQTPYKVTTRAFLAGVKGRIVAPIPWVAPYIELGLGASAGSFVTYTPSIDIEKNGVVLHIPFTIGLSLGPQHNVDLEFTYYFHPSIEQFGGAAAFGITFPINKK
jgi:hypothetical protein